MSYKVEVVGEVRAISTTPAVAGRDPEKFCTVRFVLTGASLGESEGETVSGQSVQVFNGEQPSWSVDLDSAIADRFRIGDKVTLTIEDRPPELMGE